MRRLRHVYPSHDVLAVTDLEYIGLSGPDSRSLCYVS